MVESAKTILVIHPDQAVALLLKNRFETSGVKVETPQSEASAFEKTIQLVPRCILLDFRLSKDSFDALRFVRQIRAYRCDDDQLQQSIRKIPVVLLSSEGSGIRDLFIHEGVESFIEKPYDPTELTKHILEIVSKHP